MVVDDDLSFSKSIARTLLSCEFKIFCVENHQEAIKCINNRHVDIILLDVMLPDVNGYDLLTLLRRSAIEIPVLFISGMDDLESVLKGFASGGDGYLSKPYVVDELLARMRCLCRRYAKREDYFSFGDLLVNPIKRTVYLSGEKICIDTKEFDLLIYLCRNYGRIINYEELKRELWPKFKNKNYNRVTAHISSLRSKIDRSRKNKYIHSVQGSGYLFQII